MSFEFVALRVNSRRVHAIASDKTSQGIGFGRISQGMATIQIEDPIRPVRSHTSGTDIGGVYPIRAISTDRRSTDHEYQGHKEDEDSGLRRAGDFKKKQVCTFYLRMVPFVA